MLSTQDICLRCHHPSLVPIPTGSGAADEPPPLLELDEGPVYAVHTILDSQRWGSRLEYLIDWEDYRPEERFCVLCHDILNPALLKEFPAQHPDRTYRSSRAARGESRFLPIPRCQTPQLPPLIPVPQKINHMHLLSSIMNCYISHSHTVIGSCRSYLQ